MTLAELPSTTARSLEAASSRPGSPPRSVPPAWCLAAVYVPWVGLYLLDIGLGPRLIWGVAALLGAAWMLRGRGSLASGRAEPSWGAAASLLAALALLAGGIVFGSPWLALASLQWVLLAGMIQRVPRERRGAWLAAWGALWLGLRLPGGAEPRLFGWYHASVLELSSQVLDTRRVWHTRLSGGLGLPEGAVLTDPVGLGVASVGLVAIAAVVYGVRRRRSVPRVAVLGAAGLAWGYLAQVAALASYANLLAWTDSPPRLPLQIAVQAAAAAAAFLLVFSTDRILTILLNLSGYILPQTERLPKRSRAGRSGGRHRGRGGRSTPIRWDPARWTGVWAGLAVLQIPSWLVGFFPLPQPAPLPASGVVLPAIEVPPAWAELMLIEQPAPPPRDGTPQRSPDRWTYQGPTRTLTVYRAAAAEGWPLVAGRYDEAGWDLVEVGLATPAARGQQRWMIREAAWRQQELSLSARALVVALGADGRCVELGHGQPASGVGARLFRHARGVAARLGSLLGLGSAERVQPPAEVQLALVVEGSIPPDADERKRLAGLLTMLAERHGAARRSMGEAGP